MAIEWALGQLTGSMAGELQRLLGISVNDFTQLVRSDPRAALQKLQPLVEQFRQTHPAEVGQVETIYRQYAGGGHGGGNGNNKQ